MHDNSIVILTRFNEPSKLDTARRLTLCKVNDKNKNKWYIQLSINEDTPKWQYLGSLDNEEILINLINLLQ